MGDELATIEYLREQVRSISKLASDARQERDQALEENQRLREALESIAALKPGTPSRTDFIHIARAALAREDGE